MADGTPSTPSNPNSSTQSKKFSRNQLIILWLILGAAVVLWSGVLTRNQPNLLMIVRWMATMAIMLVVMAFVGYDINGRWAGFLIDSRYKFSLSRLQIMLWTVLALSAFLTIALTRAMPGGMFPTDDPVAQQQHTECVARVTSASQAQGEVSDGAQLAAQAEEQCQPEPLNITFPPELLLALGISAASFAGSTLVQSNKKAKQIDIKPFENEVTSAQKKVVEADADASTKKKIWDDLTKAALSREQAMKAVEAKKQAADDDGTDEAAKAEAQRELAKAQAVLADASKKSEQAALEYHAAQLKLEAAQEELKKAKTNLETRQFATEGILHKNADPREARWSDMFRAEEIGINYKLLDVSKVQMAFFTVALIAAYGFALAGLLQNTAAIRNPYWVDFPAFSSTMNALLAISQATYLSVKTVDRSPTISE
jgi:hypothetical protein